MAAKAPTARGQNTDSDCPMDSEPETVPGRPFLVDEVRSWDSDHGQSASNIAKLHRWLPKPWWRERSCFGLQKQESRIHGIDFRADPDGLVRRQSNRIAVGKSLGDLCSCETGNTARTGRQTMRSPGPSMYTPVWVPSRRSTSFGITRAFETTRELDHPR